MKASVLLTILFTTSVFSGDISLSKDSLKVCNNFSASVCDHVIIRNNSDDTVVLDSAYILFDELDTTGMTGELAPDGSLEAHWIEPLNEGDFGWHLKEVATDTFKFVKNYFHPNDAVPLRCAPHDSCDLHNFEIGIYLVSAHFPIYPNYLKGTLLLYFNNNDTIGIALYSDDLRTTVASGISAKKRTVTGYTVEYISLDGKRIMNGRSKAMNMVIVHSKGEAGTVISSRNNLPRPVWMGSE